jgi:glycosyltransferase involved in cell wall biosynthesis
VNSLSGESGDGRGTVRRIAVVIDRLEPGGAEQLLIGLAGALNRAGIDVSVICLQRALGPIAQAVRAAGATVEGMDLPRLAHPAAIPALRHRLLQLQPDVVHSHLQDADILAGLARPDRVPLVSTRHLAHTLPGRRNAVRDRLAAYVLWRRAARIIAVSRFAAGWYQSRFPTRRGQLVVVPNGVTDHGRRRQRALVRAELGVPGGSLVAAMAGVMRPGKGHDVAIRVMERVAPAAGGVLLLIGDGPREDQIRATAAQSVADIRLLGHRTDVPDLLAASDLLLLPSEREALPTVAIEAMAVGIPVVATRTGGIPEVVTDGETGMLRSPGDVEGLARAVNRLAAEPDLAAELGRRSRARYEREFTVERWADRLRALYEVVAAERRHPKRPT